MTESRPPESTDALIVVDLGSIRSGALSGLFGICFVAIGYALSDRRIDDLASTAWVYLLLGGLIFSYGLAGYAAGRTRPAMPLTQGILVGFIMFVAWMLIRAAIATTTSRGSAFALSQLSTNLVLAPTCAMFASRFASKNAPR